MFLFYFQTPRPNSHRALPRQRCEATSNYSQPYPRPHFLAHQVVTKTGLGIGRLVSKTACVNNRNCKYATWRVCKARPRRRRRKV